MEVCEVKHLFVKISVFSGTNAQIVMQIYLRHGVSAGIQKWKSPTADMQCSRSSVSVHIVHVNGHN